MSLMNAGNNPKNRSSIRTGICVDIVTKQDQRSNKRTRGMVLEILTNSSFHPHGIKVRLEDGKVGRVVAIVSDDPADSGS